MLLAGSAVFLAGQAPAPALPAPSSGSGQAPSTSSGQAPQQPTFKVQVDYVEVDALVTDRAGKSVADLKKEDFQVFEDGKPQTVTTFSLVNIPVEHLQRPLGAALPIEPDVKTNEDPFDGRVYVMVIDDMHTRFERTERVKRAAKQFIDKSLGANDLMAVLHTAGSSEASQEFTSNKRLLDAAVDRTMGRKIDSATAGKTQEYFRPRPQGGAVTDPADAERTFNARSTLDVLRQVSDWFGSVHGRRKAILFVSEGIDYDINDVFNNQGASTVIDATRDAIIAATRSNVSIYGIDPRGLTDLGDEDIEISAYPDDPTLGIGRTSMQNELRLSQDSLRTLSDQTGGFAVVNRNEFGTAFDRIVQDNSSYYVLAYYPPTTDKRDTRFHKIEVRVARPGLSVRARQGYATPKAKPAAKNALAGSTAALEVQEALESPLPISGLTLHVFAAPFKGSAPNASVLLGIELRGRDLRMDANSPVNLSYEAVDAKGKIRGGGTNVVPFNNVKPESKPLLAQTGLRLLNRMDLPPGRYQVRVAANETGGGAIGSILYDLEVPDFYKTTFSMSGLTVTSMVASRLPTIRPDEQLKAMLPAPPAALRTFENNDEIALFVEVYDNAASSPHKVDITTTVTSDAAREVFKTTEERSSSDIQGKGGGYGYGTRVPLRDIPPGIYALKVEARSRLGHGAVASREVQFTVK
jgi:VWFA-related protein